MSEEISKILDKFDRTLEEYELDKKCGQISTDSICHLFPSEIITIKNIIKGLDNTIENLEEVVEHKENIIKEVRECIKKSSLGCDLDESETFFIKNELLEILDKEN